ncbi:hypothetical protein LTR97_006591 [Elasticomyces elasticus]|uniref:Protection of telomeres protein 1 n=1 Tax=Elasticomyces elasticus TaxID=574655 RepID=A0AAN7WAU4_9PEZI|nr:hypothetical protein LTR97_006591 [Elasticomyces elasticus]
MAPPEGFFDLATAYKAALYSPVSIIGVVIDIMPPHRVAKTGHWMFTFKLLDQSLQESVYGSEGLKVRFFKENERSLPQIRDLGDVVLLRHLKMMEHRGVPVAMCNFATKALVFPGASIPTPTYSIAYQGTNRLQSLGVPEDIAKLSLTEQAYAIKLKAELRMPDAKFANTVTETVGKKRDAEPVHDGGPPEKKARLSTFGSKFQLVRETRHMKFADLCVQVVRKFSSQFGNCELYVTDYTENREIWYYAPPEEEDTSARDGDDYGYSKQPKKAWPGPYGWMTLKVNVKDPHSLFANSKVDEGDFLLLRNVKMKIMAEGAKLEGDMWRDDVNHAQINIKKLMSNDVPELQELLARKEKYWAKRQARHPPKADEPEKLGKTERKRQKKQKQQEEQAKVAAAAALVAERNKHVRCSNDEALLMSVKDILDLSNARHTNSLPNGNSYVLPFVNTQYRTKVQVVDYEPKALEDFAVPRLSDEDEELSPIDAVEWDASQKFEWYFSLCLQDPTPASAPVQARDVAKPRMWAHLRHEDAQYLFGNDMDDPQDLRSNSQMLAKLREKMCILWGNLEEKTEVEVASNRPFECCIQEYGIELDDEDPEKADMPLGFKKLFRMFGTTIL